MATMIQLPFPNAGSDFEPGARPRPLTRPYRRPVAVTAVAALAVLLSTGQARAGDRAGETRPPLFGPAAPSASNQAREASVPRTSACAIVRTAAALKSADGPLSMRLTVPRERLFARSDPVPGNLSWPHIVRGRPADLVARAPAPPKWSLTVTGSVKAIVGAPGIEFNVQALLRY